jgi:hypothetical protein
LALIYLRRVKGQIITYNEIAVTIVEELPPVRCVYVKLRADAMSAALYNSAAYVYVEEAEVNKLSIIDNESNSGRGSSLR